MRMHKLIAPDDLKCNVLSINAVNQAAPHRRHRITKGWKTMNEQDKTIRVTPATLRRIANAIEHASNDTYHYGATVTIKQHPNGRQYLQFEQLSSYPEYNPLLYTVDSN